MKPKFKRAVDADDIIDVRLFLSNELMLDPRGHTFEEMKSYAEENLNDLYEPDNGKVYPTDSDEWTKDTLFEIKNDLDSNFSKQRLETYEKVAKHVLKDKAIDLEANENVKSYENQYEESYNDYQSSTKSRRTRNNNIYGGIAVAGLAASIVGICVSRALITSLGVGGLVVGGLLYLTNKKK